MSGRGRVTTRSTQNDLSLMSTLLSSGPARTDIGLVFALFAGAAGIVVSEPAMFVSAIVGFVYVGYRNANREPDPTLTLDRALSTQSPAPGATVEVTLTVTNETDEPVADLRLVDGVPERLAVVDGSPRLGTSLGPGESESLTYAIRARRGSHSFDECVVAVRNLSGSAETRDAVEIDTKLDCEGSIDDVPLTGQTITASGRVPTDSGGEGVEFYATRQHHRTDPMRRVDWKRYAKTGELTTVEFRRERAATVICLVDIRVEAHVARREGEPDAVWLSKYAAERAMESLLSTGNRAGMALYGAFPGQRYLEPKTGRDQVLRARSLFEKAEIPDASRTDRNQSRRNVNLETLLKRIPDDAQIAFFSPFLDDDVVTDARRLAAHGHSVTAYVPDLAGKTPGGEISKFERDRRLRKLHGDDVRVVLWSPDEPLRAATDRAKARWSA
ncbi:DUF58 domain-containing protein [Halogeometricum borinquense]|uniref:DUF58 domain-containing protein n=2 Tax=Halogeometricum borinquense TaxID=60847 RepID=A0A6C0ULX4_9EURY|nr:DUF58 domain-containing protein [Halogeometricum borinquense]QIQ75315.1 DUF58 domain-containing protein [Halogeometricum borinquense]